MKKQTQNLIHQPNQKQNNDGKIQKPPVVVVLGHIDHGKTSLLLAIRKVNVPSGKPGGVITQHIGAYEVLHEGRKITFIDTPGHEAFSQIRSRGAKVADIALLVIDAAEGVRFQTKEAIYQAKLAKIPIIVVLNKIDRPDANPEKIKRELQKENILVENFGGKVPCVETSAMTGKGISELLELILLMADMEDLQTDITVPAEGVIIESYLDNQRGPTATLISNQGILKPGQIIGTPSAFGKIRTLEDFQGASIVEALPSQPVVVIGFESVPGVGEKFKILPDIETAKGNLRIEEKTTLEVINIGTDQKVLNLVLKADVLGSLEAIEEILKNLPQEKIVLRILKAEVGEINESDIKLAIQAKAKILGFRVKINPSVQAFAEREKIKIMNFDVIYDLVEGVRKYMEKLLEPEIIRIDAGKMKVLVVFLTEKNRQIVGGKIIEGEIKKGMLIEIQRNGEVAGRGKIINLQRNKKNVDRLVKGEEAGILYEGNTKIEVGDILTIYTEEKQRKEL